MFDLLGLCKCSKTLFLLHGVVRILRTTRIKFFPSSVSLHSVTSGQILAFAFTIVLQQSFSEFPLQGVTAPIFIACLLQPVNLGKKIASVQSSVAKTWHF